MRLGTVARAHGVRGELKISFDHSASETLFSCKEAALTRASGQTSHCHVLRARPIEAGALLQLAEIPTRTEAEQWHGAVLSIPESSLPPTEEGEYYLYQLMGLPVSTVEGVLLGVVTDMMETGANMVLIVVGGQGEYLLPMIGSVIEEIDLVGKRIVVTLLEGLEPTPLVQPKKPV